MDRSTVEISYEWNQHVPFCVWYRSFSIRFLRFIYLRCQGLLMCVVVQYSIVRRDYILFIPLSIDGWSYDFEVGAVIISILQRRKQGIWKSSCLPEAPKLKKWRSPGVARQLDHWAGQGPGEESGQGQWQGEQRRKQDMVSFLQQKSPSSNLEGGGQQYPRQAQWSGIRLPMQEPQVLSPVWEGPTRLGSIKPACQNYWACALDPGSPRASTTEAHAESPCFATREATAMRRPPHSN